MTASLLIGLIGLTDLVRATSRPVLRWVLLLLTWISFVILASVGLAVNLIVVLVLVAVTVGWLILILSSDSDRPRRLWPAFVLGVIILGAIAVDDLLPSTREVLFDGFAFRGRAVPLDAVVAVAAVALILVRTSNLITRAALGRAAQSLPMDEDLSRKWELRVRGRVLGDIGELRDGTASVALLQGGRLIGPIERMLIVVLALVGGFVLIAALIAAKGVVRFPEISADRLSGSKAEEFLVGSLTSWSIATLGALYLAAIIYI